MLDLKTGNFINGELVDGDTEKLLVETIMELKKNFNS